jgi:hypothetical protein
MKLKIFTLLIFVAMFSVQQVYSQDISASQLNSVNIDEFSDDQISKYWDKAEAEGYSIEQLEVIFSIVFLLSKDPVQDILKEIKLKKER